MSGLEITILVVVCVAFVVAVSVIIYNKIKGKSGCDCGGSCGSKQNGKTGCNGCFSHCAMMSANVKNSATEDSHNNDT